MKTIVKCDRNDYPMLAEIWERSVRATHFFLNEESIGEIRNSLIPDYFPNVDLYGVSDNGALVGFIGLNDKKIEMLFIDDERRGLGYGTMLMDFAKARGITEVDVNEQNQSALAFYEAQGFRIMARDETDDAGRPYPILHLSL